MPDWREWHGDSKKERGAADGDGEQGLLVLSAERNEITSGYMYTDWLGYGVIKEIDSKRLYWVSGCARCTLWKDI